MSDGLYHYSFTPEIGIGVWWAADVNCVAELDERGMVEQVWLVMERAGKTHREQVWEGSEHPLIRLVYEAAQLTLASPTVRADLEEKRREIFQARKEDAAARQFPWMAA